jgi:hypothetical protein
MQAFIFRTMRCIPIGLLVSLVSPALAQLPLPPAPTGQRLPDDQIEGTIFEYQGKLTGAPRKEDEDRKLAGKFRVEGSAVFDVSPTFALPSKEQVKKAVDGVVAGKGVNLKLPPPPQQKRLGEYRVISRGKLRFDFNDKESLNGIMVVSRKKKTDDVWIGTFTEREGTRVVRTWDVELRPIQD